MAVTPGYVTVRFSGEGTALGLVTKAHPGSVVDLLVDSTRVEPDELRYSAVALARGLPRPAVDALFTDLAQRFNIVAQPIRSNPDGSVAFRWTLGVNEVPSPAFRTLARFQADFRAPWARVQAGNLSLRAELREPASAAEQMERIRTALADAGLGAELEAGDLHEGDRAILRDLEALRGTAPPPAKPSSWSKIADELEAKRERGGEAGAEGREP